MNRLKRITAAAMLALSLGGLATGADARRGGSFGSRGSRTYSAPRQTYGSGYVSPIQRSTTPRGGYSGSSGYGYGSQRPYGSGYGGGYGSGYGARRPGFGTGLVGGLVAGGLIGHFLGHGGGYGGGFGGGYGGGAGFLGGLIQLLIIGGLAWFAWTWFRRRQGARPGAGIGAGGLGMSSMFGGQQAPTGGAGSTFGGSGYGAPPQAAPWGGAAAGPQPAADDGDIGLTADDQRTFERILVDVQSAISREDLMALRKLATGEVYQTFQGEINDATARGLRNDVSNVTLQNAEVSEAWRENGVDYATVALTYSSVDVMRDRTTGAVREGDLSPSTTMEYWTYQRNATGTWRLSAIQEA